MRRGRATSVVRFTRPARACRATAYDGIVSSGDVTRALIAARAGRARVPSRPGARPADLRRPRRAVRAGRERRFCGLLRPVRRHDRDAGGLPRPARDHARARPVHDLRQSRRGGRARRRPRLLRRRASPISTPRSAARCSMPASPIGRSTSRRWRRRGRLRGGEADAARACWRSAIRCAPISRARPRSGSTACS